MLRSLGQRAFTAAVGGLGFTPYLNDPARGGGSSLGEDQITARYARTLGIDVKHLVDIGAGDGIHGSNATRLLQEGWEGLLVEMSGVQCAKLAHAYRDNDRVRIARTRVTPMNVRELLWANEVPQRFGFLSLDIDGYDHFVLREILRDFRPALICAEINEKFPPPIRFTVNYSEDYTWGVNHFYGQSISMLADLAQATGYSLLELEYNNAFLAPSEIAGPGISAEEAYAKGYAERPDRTTRFAYNHDVDPAQGMAPEAALEFLRERFRPWLAQAQMGLEPVLEPAPSVRR